MDKMGTPLHCDVRTEYRPHAPEAMKVGACCEHPWRYMFCTPVHVVDSVSRAGSLDGGDGGGGMGGGGDLIFQKGGGGAATLAHTKEAPVVSGCFVTGLM
jgi:hypothetical protein